MNQHYFDVPFAFSGDVTAIPDPLQSGGSVSMTEGWNYNYQRDLATDPAALPIDRSTMNWLLLQITTALQQLQQNSTPEFITAAQNGSVAFPYPVQAEVLWSASGSAPFTRFVNISGVTNSNTPSLSDPTGASTGWQVTCDPIATSAQASAGTNNASIMTPLLVAQQTALRALLAGNSSQVFNVATASAATQAVQLQQAQGMRRQFTGYGGYSTSQALTNGIAGEAVDWVGGTGTLTLPAPGTMPAQVATSFYNIGTGTLTLATNGAATIIYAGSASLVASITLPPGATVEISTDGTNWYCTDGLALAQYNPLSVGNASASAHAVALGQFETMAQYVATQSGTVGGPIVLGSTYNVSSVAITFPAFSKTGKFRVFVQMVGSAFSQTANVECQMSNQLWDGAATTFNGNPWNVYKKNSGYGVCFTDSGITLQTYTPGSTVTFTQRVAIPSTNEDTQFVIQNSFMRLWVIEG